MTFDIIDHQLDAHEAWIESRTNRCNRCGSDELEYNERICGDCE